MDDGWMMDGWMYDGWMDDGWMNGRMDRRQLDGCLVWILTLLVPPHHS